MAALLRRPQRLAPRSLLVRGGYYSEAPAACNGICSSSVKHPELGFFEVDGFREIARKRQLFGNGAEKYLYTMADSKTVQPCCNFRARECSAGKPFALGGVRHESVFEKRMREIRTVRARQRRLKHPSVADSTTEYSTLDEDPAQPPLSQPLLGSLKPTSPEEELLAPVLARPDLLVTRNVEWANLALGFEQENRYVIMDPRQPQAPVGYILEESNVILRQAMRTRRPFVATIFDAYNNEIFKVRRPLWLINSSIFVEVDGKVIGECHRRWHLWWRVYDIYLGKKQFALVENSGFWDWTFSLKDKEGGLVAQIDRNWRGFGYEFLTDAGQYAIRFGDIQPEHSQEYIAPDEVLHSRGPLLSTTQKHSGDQEMQQLQTAAEQVEPLQVSRILSLSERAIALALAVSLDNDYFSRHSQRSIDSVSWILLSEFDAGHRNMATSTTSIFRHCVVRPSSHNLQILS